MSDPGNDIDREQELIEQLRHIPLQDPPEELTEQIMARISSHRKSWIRTFWDFLTSVQTIRFRPAYAFSLLLVMCGTFYLGTKFQQSTSPVQNAPDSITFIAPNALNNPDSAYLIGRGLLQNNGNSAQALEYLQRASHLDPDNPEFAYWEGVGYWALGELEKERMSYLRGLQANQDSIPLLTNLGHSYFNAKNYSEALKAYSSVLSLSPNNDTALYNSGLIYRKLGMTAEEIDALRSFLQSNRTGSRALRAVKRLNEYGDLTFRRYPIGYRQIIVDQRVLLNESPSDALFHKELSDIISILENNKGLLLEIVVFVENDIKTAKSKALTLKQIIGEKSTSEAANRVNLSWFDVPETLETVNGEEQRSISEGILIFSRSSAETPRENTI